MLDLDDGDLQADIAAVREMQEELKKRNSKFEEVQSNEEKLDEPEENTKPAKFYV